MRPKILDNGDGTYVVTYTPADVGRYTVGVKYGGQNVPHAPFYVQTSPTGNAGKVKILGNALFTFVLFGVQGRCLSLFLLYLDNPEAQRVLNYSWH